MPSHPSLAPPAPPFPQPRHARGLRSTTLRPTPSLTNPLSGLVVLLALILPCAVHAQAKPAQQHTVDGTVLNAAKAPLVGAIVYLENPKSLDIQSYLTDARGHFHFNHMLSQTDYELWAEQSGVQTKHKFISQFSTHIHFHYTLSLAPAKKKFLGVL